MSHQISWTRGASQNLEHIKDYISNDNPNAAIDTIIHIIDSVELLIDNPSMGRPGRIVGTRELVIADTPYIVPYTVKKENIVILRVIHSAMKWPNKI